MSNHQDNTTAQISSSEITPTRPRQEGKLALLPTEILVKIINETGLKQPTPAPSPAPSPTDSVFTESSSDSVYEPNYDGSEDIYGRDDVPEELVYSNILSAPDLGSLAQASSSLFHRLRPSFYLADDYYVFRSALKHADADAMKRCLEFGAAPDKQWELKYVCKCGNISALDHTYHRPIDILLDSVNNGSIAISKSIEALQWLLDNGYTAREQRPPSQVSMLSVVMRRTEEEGQKWDDQTETLLPEVLIHTLAESTDDRNRTEGICQMIYMLLDHGLLIPYSLNVFDTVVDRSGNYQPMDIAMMSHCPPHFLQALLELYKRYDGHGQRTADSCPESMSSWVGRLERDVVWMRTVPRWGQRPNLGDVAWKLFRDLLGPKKAWEEAYYGEAADIFEGKINLLGKYDFIDKTETQALRGLVEGLRCIANMAESLGGLDMARDGKKCWEILCDTLRPVSVSVSLMPDIRRPQRRYRVHRFVLDNEWDPWALYYDSVLQKIDISAEYPYPWTKLHNMWGAGETGGLWTDVGFNCLKLYSRFSRRSGDKPIWVKYDYDGYLEEFHKLWLKRQHLTEQEIDALPFGGDEADRAEEEEADEDQDGAQDSQDEDDVALS